MSVEKRIRIIIRWVHIVLALVIMCYVYSPFHKEVFFQILMKFLIIPVVTLTGVWVWKFKQINRLLKISDR